MIKFFRKIRQKLLSENKVNQYLFYAIGEIILVVIGILIALGINNWNQARIEENLTADLIINYNNDLKTNRAYIKRRKHSIESDLSFLSELEERLGKTSLSSDTLQKIILKEFSPVFYSFTDIKNDTYSSLVRNNQLRFIPLKITEQMTDINFRMNDLTLTQGNVSEFYRESLNQYSFNFPMPNKNSPYSKEENEELWKNFTKAELMLAFQGVLFTKRSSYNSVIPRADSILVRIERVLNDIEEEYTLGDK